MRGDIAPVTYWGLRDYGAANQIGMERTPACYVANLRTVFSEVWRVLRDDGVVFLNLGDSYASDIKGSGGQGKSGLRKDGRDETRRLISADRSLDHQKFAPHRIQHGAKRKDLLGIPWRVAFALQADGWYLRSDIIWSKPNPMPESVTDRPTKAHEYLFLLTKSERYFYDSAAIAEPASPETWGGFDSGYNSLGLKDYEAAGVQNPSTVKARIIANARKKAAATPRHDGDRWQIAPLQKGAGGGRGVAPRGLGRNRRTVWTISTMPYAGAHFATMPEKLVEPCILAGCPPGGLVFDPFSGSGTVLAVAERLGRRGVGTDLNPAYHQLAKERTAQRGLRFVDADRHPALTEATETDAVREAVD